jgi:hypothetical protein
MVNRMGSKRRLAFSGYAQISAGVKLEWKLARGANVHISENAT